MYRVLIMSVTKFNFITVNLLPIRKTKGILIIDRMSMKS